MYFVIAFESAESDFHVSSMHSRKQLYPSRSLRPLWNEWKLRFHNCFALWTRLFHRFDCNPFRFALFSKETFRWPLILFSVVRRLCRWASFHVRQFLRSNVRCAMHSKWMLINYSNEIQQNVGSEFFVFFSKWNWRRLASATTWHTARQIEYPRVHKKSTIRIHNGHKWSADVRWNATSAKEIFEKQTFDFVTFCLLSCSRLCLFSLIIAEELRPSVPLNRSSRQELINNSARVSRRSDHSQVRRMLKSQKKNSASVVRKRISSMGRNIVNKRVRQAKVCIKHYANSKWIKWTRSIIA